MNEPSVLDTIQILRGIAEKYASFHGVRISDRALVAAAELSTRYIQGRFCESYVPLSSICYRSSLTMKDVTLVRAACA